MLPCICSVIDHRWRQNVVKTKKLQNEPQASVSQMFLAHFDVQWCDLLLNRPMATKNLFVLYNDQKRKKTNTHTCLVPHDCVAICASFIRHFQVPNTTFHLCFFFNFFLYLTVYRFFKKFLNFFCCSKQNNG